MLVISSPSGARQDNTVAHADGCNSADVKLSVSATTREPRPGEEDGVHYHFKSLTKNSAR